MTDVAPNLNSLFIMSSSMNIEKLQLTCPVCLELMIGKVYMCELGHNFCNNCEARLSNCPQCRNRLSRARNYFVENFMEQCSFKCKNLDQGCKEELTVKSYSAHLASKCQFRDIVCKEVSMSDCESTVSFNCYIRHLESQHKVNSKTNGFEFYSRFRADSLFNKKLNFPPAVIEYKGLKFFLNCAKLQNSKDPDAFCLYWWVSIFNSVSFQEQNRYRCTIEIKSKSDKYNVISWTGNVLPFRILSNEVVSEHPCLIATSSHLTTMFSPDELDDDYMYGYVEKATIFDIDSQK